ncbi:MAG: hypothetical protein JSR79_01680 [Proteobacteria bacterium]|nr:hypothetical protein [Pseudomonadota bacterium]
MIRPLILAATAAASLAAVPAMAKQSGWRPDQIGKEMSIPFIGTIGLYNFQADSDRGVWLQDQQRRWYYARIAGVCTGLPYALKIGVDTRFGGTQLDRTGILLVDGQRCHIDSLTASNGPPPKPKKVKKG